MDSNVVAREKTSGQWGVYEKYRKETYKTKTIWLEDVEIPNEGDVDDQIWDETGVITEQGSVELKNMIWQTLLIFLSPHILSKSS